ncbi:MAG: hypothetical protein U0R50_05210 [Gaiellales bacterium]
MESSSLFVAECLWPNVTRADVDALDRRLVLHARPGVEHVGTTLVPGDDVLFVWFAAEGATHVTNACLQASVPFDRVVAVEGRPGFLPLTRATTLTPEQRRVS